ncbi:MAG: hypothetical protein C0467_24985 [Planctomycetaceae bacterium]|nr:hypothetical protein [Planctomycetaceae bacterium]
MAIVTCPFCKTPLNIGVQPPRENLRCPRCNNPIRLVRGPAPVPPAPMPLPKESPEESPHERVRKVSTGKDRLIRIAIPLGYVLFVFLPMTLTIRFFLNRADDAGQQETAKAPVPAKVLHVQDEKKDTPPQPKSRPTPTPRPKGTSKPDPVRNPDPEMPEVPPKTDTVDPIPTPRDLGAELNASIAASKDPDATTRRQGAKSLGVFLGKQDNLLRRKAAETLAEMGTDAEPALAALRTAENDPDDDVQKFARQALTKWIASGQKTKQVEALLPGLKAKEPEDRIKALHKIAAFGFDGVVVSDAVIESLRDKEKSVQDAAAETLKKVNPNAEAIVLAVLGLTAKDPKVRVKTLEQIAELGPKGKIVSDLVIEAMQEKDKTVQDAAFNTLKQVNPRVEPPVATIVRGTPDERRSALPSLAELESEAECAIPLLLVMSDKPKLWGTEPYFDLFPTMLKIAPRNKRFAAAVLAAIAAPNSAAETSLTARRLAGLAQLEAIDAPLDEKVATLQLATNDNHTLPQIFKAWEQISPMDKRLTAAVLACIGGPKPVPDRIAAGIASLDVIDATTEQKVAALNGAISKGYVSAVVFDAFSKLAPNDKRFAAAVLASVATPNADPESRARRLAGIARLDAIEATPEEKVAALMVAMVDTGTISKVFEELGKIAPKDKRVVTAILEAVEAPNPDSLLAIRERRLAGIAQLGVITATTKQKVDALEAALKDKGTIAVVIKAIEDLGADAKPALPALKELKTSTNATVRNAAITAIAKIEAAIAEK